MFLPELTNFIHLTRTRMQFKRLPGMPQIETYQSVAREARKLV